MSFAALVNCFVRTGTNFVSIHWEYVLIFMLISLLATCCFFGHPVMTLLSLSFRCGIASTFLFVACFYSTASTSCDDPQEIKCMMEISK